MITMTLTGSDRVWSNLKGFHADVRDRILKMGVKAAGEPIQRAARDFAPGDTGTLKESIELKVTSKNTKGGSARCYVGINRSFKVPVRMVKRGKNKGRVMIAVPAHYAKLVEYGHRIVRNGKVIGTVAPKPFLRPAWDEFGSDVALFTFAEVAQAQIAGHVIQEAIYDAGL